MTVLRITDQDGHHPGTVRIAYIIRTVEVEQTTQELLPTMDFSKFIDELDQITKNFSDLELEPLSFNEGFDEWNQE